MTETTETTAARISEFRDHVGREVRVQGWLHNKRSSGKLQFLIVRDGTGFAQAVVAKAAVPAESWQAAEAMGQESSLELTGKVKQDARAPGGFEVEVTSLSAVQVAHDYPITPKEHGTAFLMENRHLWIRSQRQHAVLRVRHAVVKAVRDFLDDSGFTLVDTPIFTPAACEGTTTLFGVPYFDEGTAYLTQSGQLYNEATAAAHGKVYCFGPTFRAEKSKTRRHLTEFWMVEPEVAYADLNDIVDLAEGLVVDVVSRVLDRRQRELKTIERDTSRLEGIGRPFARLTYDDAVARLKEKCLPFEWGGDFGAPDETALSEMFDGPLAVTGFPSAMKAFYFKPHPDRPEVSLSVDILAPEGYGEIIGGGQRLDDPELLQQRIDEHKLPREAFEWYLDLRRYGSVPHGGFGMGIERVVSWICGLDHLREAIPYPRMLYRLSP